ncbi:MAG: hypothetical protein E6J20_18450 [Chloroflexi bacterium]|nr:MAG: hypothetical protein E6J20_18450 [Chloroflexota bacterium]
MDEDLRLEAWVREGIDRYPVPDLPLRRRGEGSGRPRLLALLAAIALLVGGAGLGQALNSYRTGVASATPDPALAPLPSSLDAATVLVLVRGWDLGRIDRIDAKLVTFEEYVRIAGPVRSHAGDPQATAVGGFGISGDPAKRSVWVVAVGGELWPYGRVPIFYGLTPPTSPTPFPPYRWAVFLVDAIPGEILTVGDAGTEDSWPSAFDRLPDHRVTAPVRATPTAPLAPLAVRVDAGEAISRTVRSGAASSIIAITPKLMTWAEFSATGGPAAHRPAGIADDTPVWIIAVAGAILPQGGGAPLAWGVFGVDGRDGSMQLLVAGAGSWPSFFDGLPNHSAQVTAGP